MAGRATIRVTRDRRGPTPTISQPPGGRKQDEGSQHLGYQSSPSVPHLVSRLSAPDKRRILSTFRNVSLGDLPKLEVITWSAPTWPDDR